MTNQEADPQTPPTEDLAQANLENELQSKNEEVERYKDMYIRSLAEMDNLRKRFEKDKSELLKYGQENILKDFLPVLDSFEKALAQADKLETKDHAHESSQMISYVDGVKLVKHQLEEVLNKHGLTPIKAQGEKFDPQLHQAIQKIEAAEASHEEVAQEYSKGYCLNGRLLRPSMVSVRVPTPK